MDDIKTELDRLGLKSTPDQISRLVQFSELILGFNSRLNLVSKRNPNKETIKQITDSYALIKHYDLMSAGSLLDIGSGGGFPGIVIKIFRPDIRLFSLDSNPRKIAFQRKAALKIGLSGCGFIDCQLKEYHPELKFDYLVAKAFGKFKKILSFARINLAIDGRMIFYLGESIPNELNDLKGSMFVKEAEYIYQLPDSQSKSRILIIKKSI